MRIKNELKNKDKIPGPGEYQIKDSPGSPQFRFGTEQRGRSKMPDFPGVGQYNLPLLGKQKAPSYSISKSNRVEKIKDSSPGPSAYSPTLIKSNKKGYSLGKSNHVLSPNKFPGPGSYDLKTPRGNGISFKGKYELKDHNITPGPQYEYDYKKLIKSSPAYS